MANNLTGGVPHSGTAKQTILFSAIAAISTASIAKIFEVGSPLKSYTPGQGLNAINGFTVGKGYYIIAKTDLDLEAYITPPITGGSSEFSTEFN